METIIKDDEIFSKAHDRYRQFTRNDELMELYEARVKYQLQYNTDMASAKEKGIEKGDNKKRNIGEISYNTPPAANPSLSAFRNPDLYNPSITSVVFIFLFICES